MAIQADVERVAQLIEQFGVDASVSLEVAMQLYQAGKADGDRLGYNRGFNEGVTEARTQITACINDLTIQAPAPVPLVERPHITTPIRELRTLDARLRSSLYEGLRIKCGTDGEYAEPILQNILEASFDMLMRIDRFGPGSLTRLVSYLDRIGYPRPELLQYLQKH